MCGATTATTRTVTPEGRQAFELSFAYFRLHREHLRRVLEPFGLTPPQMHALRALTPGEAMAMARLAEQIFVDPPNVTTVVDRLVHRQLTHRQESSTDRRVKTVMLTDEGVAVRVRLNTVLAELPDAIACLSPQEQRQLRGLLRRMVDNATPRSTTPA